RTRPEQMHVLLPLSSAEQDFSILLQRTRQHSAILWSLLVLIPYAGWVFVIAALFLLTRDSNIHETMERSLFEDLDRTVTAAGRAYLTWRSNPTRIVPRMLGTALSVIEQSIVTTGLIVFLGTLAMNGTLSGLLTQLSSRGLTLSLLQNSSYSSLLIPIAVISTIVVLLTAILGGGFVYSSEYG